MHLHKQCTRTEQHGSRQQAVPRRINDPLTTAAMLGIFPWKQQRIYLDQYVLIVKKGKGNDIL